ncbi:MAG: tetratricopeptide repeat protein, partial [Fimbriimonas ginsengisoli]|nr:tetratricopeptide repeat protein [Fimbriimonas ginsengisoli]
LFNKGDLAGARYHYNMVVSADPTNSRALNGRGLCLLKESKLAPAVQAFNASIRSDSKFVPAYNNLAVAQERQGKRKLAIRTLKKALKIDPDNADVNKNLKRMQSAE